jgi:hypothetical protein
MPTHAVAEFHTCVALCWADMPTQAVAEFHTCVALCWSRPVVGSAMLVLSSVFVLDSVGSSPVLCNGHDHSLNSLKPSRRCPPQCRVLAGPPHCSHHGPFFLKPRIPHPSSLVDASISLSFSSSALCAFSSASCISSIVMFAGFIEICAHRNHGQGNEECTMRTVGGLALRTRLAAAGGRYEFNLACSLQARVKAATHACCQGDT